MSEWDEKFRDLQSQKRKFDIFSYVSGIFLLIGFFAIFYFISGLQPETGPIEFRWDGLGVGIVTILVGLLFLKKVRTTRLKSTENNFLVFWKAYKMIKKFYDRKEEADMNNAVTSVKSIKDLFSSWFTKDAPKSISSLTDPIVNSLNEKIIPLIKERNFSEIYSFSTACMNEALVLYNNGINQEFLKSFQERLSHYPNPAIKEKLEITKPSKWKEYPILKVFWVPLPAGGILYFVLTSAPFGMEPGYALLGGITGGIALAMMIMQGIKK